ncbi:MAG: helix-turn-helix transcriptional regulator [Treponema sp.]|nr:helix-turn-helix transcriptional regulator [Treponema sp.]
MKRCSISKIGVFLFLALLVPSGFLPVGVFAQSAATEVATASVASLTDGVTVHYYTTLHEALRASANTAAADDSPNEITILADIVLNEPLLIEDGVHLRLAAGNANVTIRRGDNNIKYPVIWVKGEGASLHLGKPGMEYALFIDGGYLDSGIEAHAPLAALSGPDAKLYMYDKVFLQNNYNNGDVSLSSYFENGGGVIIRTAGDLGNQQAQFVMKGGTIRGNTNNVPTYMAYGGAVQIVAYGIFIMEGGMIMDNTARVTGGGVAVGGRGTFKKTGGIIYGKNAPPGYRNTAVEGVGKTKTLGHAVRAAPGGDVFYYRNDTIAENDCLTYTGASRGGGTFGEGEKWDNSNKALWRRICIIIFTAFAIGIPVFLTVMRSVQKKQIEKLLMQNHAPEVNLENMGLSPREKDVCKLLLTALSLKQIAFTLKISYSGVNFHVKNIYGKLGFHSREELMVKMRADTQ